MLIFNNEIINPDYLIENTSSSSPSPINLDDISINIGQCPQPISCDFNEDMCGFVQNSPTVSGSVWTWDHGFGRVENASQLSFKYPPEDRKAPRIGMFLYTDFTSFDNLVVEFRHMRLDSEFVVSTTGSCLTFYYIVMDFVKTQTTFSVNAYDNSGIQISYTLC